MTHETSVSGLPELPEPFCYVQKDGYHIGTEKNSTYFRMCIEMERMGKPRWRDGVNLLYTADALHAYGQRCIDLAPKSNAALVEALERIGWHELTSAEARDIARAALATHDAEKGGA